jgi:hypothetical protein
MLLITALIAALATSVYAAANPAEAARQNKLVGTWVCSVHEGAPDAFKALQTFHADGTFTETSSLLAKGEEGPAQGVWAKSAGKGENVYDLTFQLFAFDPASRESVGMLRIRISLRLDGADHLTATSEFAEFVNPDGTITELGGGPDAYTCDRLQVIPVP